VAVRAHGGAAVRSTNNGVQIGWNFGNGQQDMVYPHVLVKKE
jgi:hypothetical protein